MLTIKIEWSGPYELEEVISKFGDTGKAPDYDGSDYGLYQIYGEHVLGDRNALLYIGKATEQTFSTRFKRHKHWLKDEDPTRIYLGRIYNGRRHVRKDNWETWKEDVSLAERVLIYTYSPHYNSSSITNRPKLAPHKSVKIVNRGEMGRLSETNRARDDQGK